MSRTVPQPNEISVKQYPTPSWGTVVDELLVEPVEFNAPGYVKLKEGSAHPDTVRFPNHRLLKESYSGRFGINTRYWCNGYRNEDQYNYDIDYSGDETSHPIFSRKYQVRRDLYDPLVKETKFTGVYLIEVTNGGSGYNPEVPPTVTITGNATANALVNPLGEVVWIYLTDEGSGYTSVPTVTIAAPTAGVQATAEAKLMLDTGVVYDFTITNGGTLYTTAPTVTIAAPASGVTATAVAQISGGSVVALQIVTYGSGYTSVPGVSFSGGGGSGAAATAILETATCRLVKESAHQFPEDDPRRSLYLLVERQWETFPGPYLIEHRYEPYLDIYVSTLKRTVLGSTVPPDMTYVNVSAGEIIEYSPLSKHRSVQMISRINTGLAWENGGADFEYRGTVNYSFPNEIQDDPVIDVYAVSRTVNNSTTLDIDFGWRLNVLEGYSGACEARFVQRYTFDPTDPLFQAALPAVTYIKPEAAVINDGFVFVDANMIARATQFNIPSTLHPVLNIDTSIHGSSIVVDLVGPVATIPATVPTGLPSGTEICVSVKPTRWRFGLWVYDIVYVTVPSPPP